MGVSFVLFQVNFLLHEQLVHFFPSPEENISLGFHPSKTTPYNFHELSVGHSPQTQKTTHSFLSGSLLEKIVVQVHHPSPFFFHYARKWHQMVLVHTIKIRPVNAGTVIRKSFTHSGRLRVICCYQVRPSYYYKGDSRDFFSL